MTTDYYAQGAVSEIKHELEELRNKYVYLKVIGDIDPQPFEGFVSDIGGSTVEITSVSEPTPPRAATRLNDADPGSPAMQERTRLRIDHILSVTEVTIAAEVDQAEPEVDAEIEPAEIGG